MSPVVPGGPVSDVPGDTTPSYTTPDQLRIALAPDGETGPDSAAEMVDLQDAINDAQSEVDGKLAGLYVTPFAQPPPIIVAITRDIAMYLATLTHRRGDPVEPTDPVQLRYNRAQMLLTQIQAEQINLDVAVVGEPEVTERGDSMVVNTVSNTTIFDLDDANLVEAPSGKLKPRYTGPFNGGRP